MCDKSVVILKKLETALGKINSSRSSSSLLGLPLSSLQPRSFFGPRPSLRLPLWPKRCACTVERAAAIDQLDKYTESLAPADFSGAVFTFAHFQKLAQISSLCDIHYISEEIPSLVRFWLVMT